MTESKAGLQEFRDERYRDAHEGYVRWLRHHPRGFVLNLKTSTCAGVGASHLGQRRVWFSVP